MTAPVYRTMTGSLIVLTTFGVAGFAFALGPLFARFREAMSEKEELGNAS